MEREPLMAGRLKRRAWGLPSGLQRAAFVLVPWLAFCGTGFLFLFCYHKFPQLVIFSTGCWVALFIGGFLLAKTQKVRGEAEHREVVPLLCLVATVAGIFAGAWNYTRASGVADFWALGERRSYTNVWPDELADAHRDAAVMVFSHGARLEPRMLSGYKASNGQTYCVVPITSSHNDYSGAVNVQYFAAGKDCCSNREFTCGDALNKDAHAGLVIYNKTDLLHSMFFGRQDLEHYLQAAEMTSGKYGVQRAKQPIFLDWVADVDNAVSHGWFQAQRYWLYSCILAWPLILALGLLMEGHVGAIVKGTFDTRFKTDGVV
eukprot:TRINITY_DN17312_c0_g1_i2.p1 TRINITY_DN17312_c0_g1~~TRINITY_DN17312_c0_g1_i2.p1  ORF type:complete len:318 (-),score=47.64 TRINITY_DN17312_c0_g1_i2:29-982(-)